MSSDFLFARPSLLSGMARLVDLRGAHAPYNESATPADADERAFRNDWRAIGADGQIAMERFRAENREAVTTAEETSESTETLAAR